MAIAVLFSGSAIALNNYVSDNTPENGYLLCANFKTKAVTFPNKLSCPSGTKALDLGAVTKVERPKSSQGLPATTSGGKTYNRLIPSIDIIADGTYSTFASLKQVVLSKISPTDMPIGSYGLSAYVSGVWADNVPDGSPFICYFQTKKNFDLGNARTQRGGDRTENGSWTGIELNPRGEAYFTSLSEDPIYLVCSTGGTVKDLDAYVIATSIDPQQLKNTLG